MYISEIQCAKWPAALTEQMASFLFALENYLMARVADYGKRVMLLVQASVCHTWHSLLKTPQNFNISVINNTFIDHTVLEYIHALQYADIGRFLSLSSFSPPPPPSLC